MTRRPPRRPSRRVATRIAFAVIVTFVLAQVTWWLVFQTRLLDDAARERSEAWARDVATANEVLARDPGALDALLARYPHLRSVAGADGPTVAVDPAVAAAAREEAAGQRRMLAFEGPFFAVVILLMLALIAGSLRTERELKQRQQNFLSAVTHEFKTPIGTLRLLLETLRYRDVPAAKRADYLARIDGELARLEKTSDEVLAAARLETSGAPPVLEAADLGDAVRRTVERLRGGLEARGADLRVEPMDGPAPVSLAPESFALALGNLLENALKYTPGERKRIVVRVDASGDPLRVHVDDAGPGVPAGERGKIFDRFYRAGDEMTRTSAGVGLGLHLVRNAVQAMNGWVAVADAPGGGARFTIHLPRRVGDDAVPGGTTTGGTTAGGSTAGGTVGDAAGDGPDAATAGAGS